MKYKFEFTGRQNGAIGIFYYIKEYYECENLSQAKSLLYRDYEHISNLKINNGNISYSEFSKAQFIDVPKRDHVNNPRK